MLDRLCPPLLPYDRDDDLIKSAKITKLPKIHCYPFNETVIVAGRGSHISQEIYMESVKQDHIPVLRRKGGGCSVLLDPGNLIISIAFPAPGFLNINYHFNKCISWLMKGLKKSGLKNIYKDGISDIVLENKKIGGTCFQREKDFAYFSASILVSPDLDLMDKYLQMPLRQPEYRKGRGHSEFLTTITSVLNKISVADFSVILAKNLENIKPE